MGGKSLKYMKKRQRTRAWKANTPDIQGEGSLAYCWCFGFPNQTNKQTKKDYLGFDLHRAVDSLEMNFHLLSLEQCWDIQV